MVQPDKKEFLYLINKGKVLPLYSEIPYNNPSRYYSVFKGKNTFLLESIKGPFSIARYSFIGFDPYMTFKVKNSEIEITRINNRGTRSDYDLWSSPVSSLKSRPLTALKKLVYSYPQLYCQELPPFQGGAVGMLSYDFVRYLENIPARGTDDLNIPDAHFFLIDKAIVFDHKLLKAWIVYCPGLRMGDSEFDFNLIDWERAYDMAVEEIIDTESAASTSKDSSLIKKTRGSVFLPEIVPGMSQKQYMDRVKRVLEYIAAGDIFQANLSLRVSADIKDIDPWDIYGTLSSINPAPFACYIDFDDYQVVSSSPERLVTVRPEVNSEVSVQKVEARPIAGTRRRGRDVAEDSSIRTELLLNEKERAEHIMLIDLERNDLGKVCNYGSIHVNELMITEDYSHVIHIVSNIAGNMAPGKDSFGVIRALFPGGTITGVPKVRCMEIIDELEPVMRGPYTGSVGYIGFSKSMDLNIIIRTFVIKNRTAYVQAGAGIVSDSDPEKEYFESLNKAEALIRTLKEV